MSRPRVIVIGLLLIAFAGRSAAQTPSDRTAGLYRDSYALEAKGDYAGALGKMREVRQAAGPSYFAVVRIAWLQYLAGDFTGAAASYTEAAGLEPKALEPKLGLTLPLLAAKNWKSLERACRDVLAVDPRNASGLARLAQAQYWSNNYADAAATYRQLVADYPSNLDYQTGLAWAVGKSGSTATARQMFQAVLNVSPDNPNAKQGLATIK